MRAFRSCFCFCFFHSLLSVRINLALSAGEGDCSRAARFAGWPVPAPVPVPMSGASCPLRLDLFQTKRISWTLDSLFLALLTPFYTVALTVLWLQDWGVRFVILPLYLYYLSVKSSSQFRFVSLVLGRRGRGPLDLARPLRLST